jgi:hypothetical protein
MELPSRRVATSRAGLRGSRTERRRSARAAQHDLSGHRAVRARRPDRCSASPVMKLDTLFALRTSGLFLAGAASIAGLGSSVAGCSAPAESAASTGAAVSASSAPDPSAFTLPPSDATARAQILSAYDFVDPQGIVPRGLLEDALEYYDLNKSLIPNTAYIAVIDFSKYSGDYRFFVVNMSTGSVEQHKVAHGSGSDPSSTGYTKYTSNVSGSYMSSLGFYLTGSMFNGTHPNSLHLYGLSDDGSPNSMANSNVYDRAILVHPATYVSDSNSGAQGRSEGCFALDPNIELEVANKLVNGAMMYAEKTSLNTPVGRSGGEDAGASGDSGPAPGGGCELGGQSYRQNTCTETLQCSDGAWVTRASDASACNMDDLPAGACLTDTGAVVPQNTCTSTLQCDESVWVGRSGDTSACL